MVRTAFLYRRQVAEYLACGRHSTGIIQYQYYCIQAPVGIPAPQGNRAAPILQTNILSLRDGTQSRGSDSEAHLVSHWGFSRRGPVGFRPRTPHGTVPGAQGVSMKHKKQHPLTQNVPPPAAAPSPQREMCSHLHLWPTSRLGMAACNHTISLREHHLSHL